MSKHFFSNFAICVGLLLMSSILNSCVKEETFSKASIETSQVTSVTEATAICGGLISTDGGSNVTTRGVCWSTTPYPTIENDTTIDNGGTGSFISLLKGLTPSTTYFIRAYAVNKGGVVYGLQMTFTTKTFSITTTPIAISFVTATSAIGGGNIISDGDSSSLTVKARGVCWNTFPSPTIENCKTIDGVGGGRFTSKIDSLKAFTTYYARAYATNVNGTIYGNEVTFNTQSGVVVLETIATSAIMAYTATSGGMISSDGGAAVTARGICWSTSSTPTVANIKTDNGGSIGSYTSSMTGLTPGTTYFVRSYAINGVGTSYGNEVTFSTQNGVVGLTTSAASSITAYAASCSTTISSDGGAAVTSRGVCWNTSSEPTISNNKTDNGSGIGSYVSSITGLTPGTTYYVRSYATNNVGTSYGNQVTFTTLSGVVNLVTSAISSITTFSANSGGTISSDGGADVIARGVCWNTTSAPTILNSMTTNGSGIGNFTSSITGLSPCTTYYIRSYATNSVGTSYGNELTFTTFGVVDIDGNVYSSVKIGTQEWMVENLKTTKFNDGTSIPYVTNNIDWINLSTPGYCFLMNGAIVIKTYGAYYNWYTLNTGKLAPKGWHVPTNADWTTLENYLIANGYNFDGTVSENKIAKSLAAQTVWSTSIYTGTIGNFLSDNNKSGFSGLPSGYRGSFNGSFDGVGIQCSWWSSTAFDQSSAWNRYLSFEGKSFYINQAGKSVGIPVRCIRDL